MVDEAVVNYIPNAGAWAWMKDNVPFFACPDKEVEEIYYYRWWAFRKHIKKTPAGFVITEFLKPVGHATEYNAISCALGHHIAEGRWLHDPQYLDAYIRFWLRSGANGGLQPRFHQFSGWAAAALYERWLVDGNRSFLLSLLDPLILDYRAWERERLLDSGLFWQRDVSDGMEESISGGRKVRNVRPTINSYMYGNAKAIAAVAALDGKAATAREYSEKAARLKQLVEERLWDTACQVLRDPARVGDLGRCPRADRIHSLVLRSAGRHHRVWGRLEAAHGSGRILRALRPHHRREATPWLSHCRPRRRLPVERPELALRHHGDPQGAGQSASQLPSPHDDQERLFRDLSNLHAEPALEAARRPHHSLD